MFETGRHDFVAGRYVPWVDYVEVVGYDWSGGVFLLQVRDHANGGTLRIEVIPVATVTVDAGIATTRLSWTVAKAVIEAIPTDPAQPDADVTLVYDIHATPAGGTEFVLLAGKLVIAAGVTE